MSKGKRVAAPARTAGKHLKALPGLLAGVSLLLFLFGCVKTGAPQYEAPVIQGVQADLSAVEGEELLPLLLNGVTAVGGPDRPNETFPVTVELYDQNGAPADITDCIPGTYRVVYSCTLPDSAAAPVLQTFITVTPADTEAPVISGAKDLEVPAGGTVSYREGVTVTDNKDTSVQLKIDSSAVNLAEPGLYMATYSATDAAGNCTEVVIQVTVTEAVEEKPEVVLPPIPEVVTQEMVDELCDKILARIVTDDMSLRDKAYKVYKYVYSHIKYVGSSDKSSWLKGAYTGFVHGRGDCYNYFACSKALLTRLGIPNVDLQRVGGTTRHYWQLVNVGDGWYHFDACWHPVGFNLESFMLTEAEVRAYTELVSGVRKNYFVYDYNSCPVIAVGTPEEEAQARRELWAAQQAGTATDPNAPAEPVSPADPGTSADTPVLNPDQNPVLPVEPEIPVVDPNQNPLLPAEPETPTVNPDQNPVLPVEPDAPTQPDIPAEDETADNPDQEQTPGTSAQETPAPEQSAETPAPEETPAGETAAEGEV